MERQAHQQVIQKVKNAFDSAQIDYLKNDSHIIPIIIGDPVKARLAGKMLLEKHGIYIQHINFPTVSRGSERLRIIPTPWHTDAMIKDLTLALIKTFNSLNIEYQAKSA